MAFYLELCARFRALTLIIGVGSSRGLVVVGCPTGLGLRLLADELEAEIAQPVEESVKL